jgi:hypothetical protein
LVRGGLLLTIAGAFVVWSAGQPWLGGLGLLLAGLGVAGQYPLNTSVTLPLGAAAPAAAAARLTLASGVAILSAPFVLGALADLVGVASAWLLVPALCGVALLLSWAVPGAPVAAPVAARGQ